MKKIVLAVLVVFVMATVLTTLVACADNGKADGPVGIYKDGKEFASFTKDGDNYYAKVDAKSTTSLAVVDGNGHSHTVTLPASDKAYTIVALKGDKGYTVEAWPEKKAVVWVTALLSGGFYDVEEEKAVWDPLPFDDVKLIDFINPDKMGESVAALLKKILPKFDDIFGATLENEESSDNFIWSLALNGLGEPNNPNVVTANGIDHRCQYGVLSAYQDHAEDLRATFPDTEIVIFNYDWRMDNRNSVDALQNYIYEHKYTDVVMFSHSLGGNIVAGYLAKNQFNRSLVDRYVSFGGAFLGSFDALFAIEDTQQYLMAVAENMGMSLNDLPSWLLNAVDLDTLFGVLQDFLVNMYSFPQLVPTFELISGKQYSKEDGDGEAITVDGVAITTEEELYAFYETRPWAWQRDADNEYVYDANGNHVIREVVKDLKKYHDSLYVYNADGTRTFSTDLVDTYYVTGRNIITFCGADYSGSGEDEVLEYRTTLNGDKQVLLYSTLINQEPEDLDDKFLGIDGYDHFQVGCDYNLVKDIIKAHIQEVFYPETVTK